LAREMFESHSYDIDRPGLGAGYVDLGGFQSFVHKHDTKNEVDQPVLDLLKIDPESQIEMTTDGKSIQITPLDVDNGKAKVRDARAKVNAKLCESIQETCGVEIASIFDD